MPYCPKCGIEVDYGILKCPLCSFDIPEVPPKQEILSNEVELKNYYSELKMLKSKRRKFNKKIVFILILLITAGAVFNNAMQDLFVNGELTFSFYILSSFALFIVCMISLFGLIKGWKNNLIILFISTALFILTIDLWSGGIDWYWNIGLPIVILSYGLLFLSVLLLRKLKPGKLYGLSIILFISSIFLILLEVILDSYFGAINLRWSIQALIPNGSFALLCIAGRQLVNHDFFKKLKRYLHF